MKIQILADLHLEFLLTGTTPPVQARALLEAIYEAPADVTVLAGDIYTKGRSARKARELVPPERPIVMVSGNHEHYSDTYQYSMARMRRHAEGLPNVHFLENDHIEIDGFAGRQVED